MIIKQVSYKKLVSTENYSNFEIGGVADVGEKEKPSDTLTALAYWVHEEIGRLGGIVEPLRNADEKLMDIEYKVSNLESQKKSLSDTIKRMVDFLEKHGVDIKDDIPF